MIKEKKPHFCDGWMSIFTCGASNFDINTINKALVMKNLIIVFIILPLLGLSQKQFTTIASERKASNVKDMPKGDVKFVTTRGSELPMDSIFFEKVYHDMYFERAEVNGKADSVIFNKKGNIEAIFSLWLTSGEGDSFFSYDSLDNLVEIIERIDARETFKYDKAGNCTEWRTFYNNKLQGRLVENEYKGNIVTSYYYKSDTIGKNKWFEKTITSIENNKKSIITYRDGRKTGEDYEIKKGDTTIVSYINYDANGTVDTSTNITITNKRTKIERSKSLCDIEFISETTFNDNGDMINCDDREYTHGKLTKKIVKTYKYEYDSHDNYIKKTIYLGDIPVLEITRNIGYY